MSGLSSFEVASHRTSVSKFGDDRLSTGFVEVRFKGLVVPPPADLHHKAGIHPLANKARMGEIAVEVVRRLPKAFLARTIGCRRLGDRQAYQRLLGHPAWSSRT
jgi:hypothetical protein